MPKLTDHNLRECPAMRALESLTAQGSEFVDDIPRCVAYVKAAHESQHTAIVKFKTERDALARSHERLVAAALDMLKMGEHEGDCDNEDADEPRACQKHLAASEARKINLRAALAEAEKVSQ